MTHKSPDHQPTTAFYAGSFNPFTTGHLNIVERGLKIFPRIIIGIGLNPNKPHTPESIKQRVEEIDRAVAHLPGVSVTAYDTLTVDKAREMGATVLLRGVRSISDFDYERNLADINRSIAPDLDTVILFADPVLGAVSSSMVRELKSYHHDISQFLPHHSTPNS